MARKQDDYLNALLEADPAPEPGASAERARTSPLISREMSLARIHSGEARQVTQLLLDPARVRVWPGNARLARHLTERNCRALIDSIIAEGGQKVPAVIRRITGDPAHDYEVIAGTRRHWAITWLRANSYPEMRFLAQVLPLDDEAAFRLADLENRARQDISDFERARNYAAAIGEHYGGKQRRMAERLRVSEGWLSKMLQVAALPDGVIDAFASVHDIQLKPAYLLVRAMADKAAGRQIATAARQIAREQEGLRAGGRTAIAAGEVLRRLLHAANPPDPKPDLAALTYMSRLGRPALSVRSANRQGVTIRLHAGCGADPQELASALKAMLERLEASGRGQLR